MPSLSDHQPSEAFIRALTESPPALRGDCHASLGQSEEAKEALQRTSIVLWKKCGDWDPATEILRWAITVAKFEVLGVIRDRQRGPACHPRIHGSLDPRGLPRRGATVG